MEELSGLALRTQVRLGARGLDSAAGFREGMQQAYFACWTLSGTAEGEAWVHGSRVNSLPRGPLVWENVPDGDAVCCTFLMNGVIVLVSYLPRLFH